MDNLARYERSIYLFLCYIPVYRNVFFPEPTVSILINAGSGIDRVSLTEMIVRLYWFTAFFTLSNHRKESSEVKFYFLLG
jgi:phenylalanine-4-hydroxylase